MRKGTVRRMSKRLVAYFSATGRTREIAENLAAAVGADLYEVRPEVLYTKADLNWMNSKSRSTIEMHDLTYRPKLADHDAEIEKYDTIFLGFPIWWHMAPTIMNTFLESYDFSRKKLVLFATSGGSGMDDSMKNLKVSAPSTAVFVAERLLRGYESEVSLRECADHLNV